MIDRDKVRKATEKAIEQMPTKAIIMRQEVNTYNEPTGNLIEICELTGVFYKENSRWGDMKVSDSGVILGTDIYKFLTVYSENVNQVKKLDMLRIEGKGDYQILDPNENMEIFFDMVLKSD